MEYLATTINQCVRFVYILPFLIIATIQYVKGGYGKLDYRLILRILLILGFILLVNLGSVFPRHPIFHGLRWNWQYKLWQISIALVFIFLVFRRPCELGLRLPEKGSRSVMWIVLACMVVFTTAVALWNRTILFSREGALGIETLPLVETTLFEAFMPGLSEELIYRGIVLLGFAGIFSGPKINLVDAPVGWEAPISIFLFTLAHNTFVDPSTLAIDFFAVLRVYTPVDWILNIISTGFMTWIVLRTKSILPSIVMHGYGAAIGPLLTLVLGR
jgi:membrane protease YdiL (CAAX protease family)